jgi:hypothetical protein
MCDPCQSCCLLQSPRPPTPSHCGGGGLQTGLQTSGAILSPITYNHATTCTRAVLRHSDQQWPLLTTPQQGIFPMLGSKGTAPIHTLYAPHNLCPAWEEPRQPLMLHSMPPAGSSSQTRQAHNHTTSHAKTLTPKHVTAAAAAILRPCTLGSDHQACWDLEAHDGRACLIAAGPERAHRLVAGSAVGATKDASALATPQEE